MEKVKNQLDLPLTSENKEKGELKYGGPSSQTVQGPDLKFQNRKIVLSSPWITPKAFFNEGKTKSVWVHGVI